jgi:hypothetical protein
MAGALNEHIASEPATTELTNKTRLAQARYAKDYGRIVGKVSSRRTEVGHSSKGLSDSCLGVIAASSVTA